MWDVEKQLSGMKDMKIITSAMECIPSVCFEAWAAVHDFSPELIALSFRLFVCWFFLDQFVGIVAASDVDFECASDLDEKLGKFSSKWR